MIKPIQDKILVEVTKVENSLGLILPDEKKTGKKLEQGTIIDCGQKVEQDIKNAKIIMFDHFAGTPISLGKKNYVMIKSEEVQAIKE